jgi:hypothetical protein
VAGMTNRSVQNLRKSNKRGCRFMVSEDGGYCDKPAICLKLYRTQAPVPFCREHAIDVITLFETPEGEVPEGYVQ